MHNHLAQLPAQAYFDAVYLHLPFCRRICPFCSFAVVKDNQASRLDYINLLLKEIKLWQTKFGKDVFSKCTSFYIGGGTPSLAGVGDIKKIFESLNLPKDICFSFEINPEDCKLEYLLALANIGVNRVSLGVQSFLDKGLTTLKRAHNANQNYAALKALLNSGIKNFNLDMMYGYPGQTLADLSKDIKIFLSFSPPHLSAYGLTLEPKTPAYKSLIWQKWQADNENLFTKQFSIINAKLKAHNLKLYEISNFAKDGYKSPQNLIYWESKSFLGIGLGAFSRLANYRFSNSTKLSEWKLALSKNKLPTAYVDLMDNKKKIDEQIIIGLRLSKGLEFSRLSKLLPRIDWPSFFAQKLNNLVDLGYIKITKNALLPRLRGLMLSDQIALQISTLIEKQDRSPNF